MTGRMKGRKRRYTRKVSIHKSCSKLRTFLSQARGRIRKSIFKSRSGLLRKLLQHSVATVSHAYGVATVGVGQHWKKKKKKKKKKKGATLNGKAGRNGTNHRRLGAVIKTLTTLIHKSPHRIPLRSLWRALKVGEGPPVARQNLPLRSLWRPLNVGGGAHATQQNNPPLL
jgi:hypothetical protein